MTICWVWFHQVRRVCLSVCWADINGHCSPNPCMNGATCVDEVNGYTCACVTGYTGVNCQTGKTHHWNSGNWDVKCFTVSVNCSSSPPGSVRRKCRWDIRAIFSFRCMTAGILTEGDIADVVKLQSNTSKWLYSPLSRRWLKPTYERQLGLSHQTA